MSYRPCKLLKCLLKVHNLYLFTNNIALNIEIRVGKHMPVDNSGFDRSSHLRSGCLLAVEFSFR